MLAFFWRAKNKNGVKESSEPKVSLRVNYVYRQYDQENEPKEIEQLTMEIFAFKSVDVGGPMSVEEAKELNYPKLHSFNYKYPIIYVFDESNDPNHPIFISTDKDEVIQFIGQFEQKVFNEKTI